MTLVQADMVAAGAPGKRRKEMMQWQRQLLYYNGFISLFLQSGSVRIMLFVSILKVKGHDALYMNAVSA